MKRFTMAIAVAAIVSALAVSAFAQGGSTTPSAQPATPASEPAKAAPAEKPAHSSHASHAAMHKTDINSASREDLMKLPGVTDAVADKIIAARPFKMKKDLVTQKIVTAKEYTKITGKIIAKQSQTAGATK